MISSYGTNEPTAQEVEPSTAGASGGGDLGVVWVVTKTYGITIEGDTEVKGVYSSREGAQAAFEALDDPLVVEIREWRLDAPPAPED